MSSNEITTALENVLTPASEITIAGKLFKLVFDFDAVALIEEKTGRNLITKDGWDKINGTHLAIFFWATLQHFQPSLSLKDVRRMMNQKNMALIEKTVAHAWVLSSDEKKDEETKQDPQ